MKVLKLVVVGCYLGVVMSGCGASFGSSAIGTVEFMAAHNRKVQIMQGITNAEEQGRWVK